MGNVGFQEARQAGTTEMRALWQRSLARPPGTGVQRLLLAFSKCGGAGGGRVLYKQSTEFFCLQHLPPQHSHTAAKAWHKATHSPQLLSPSLSCTLMKFSIQNGSQTQRLVKESQWPWSEQFS